MTSTIENHLTVAEAAATLHVAQSTIRRWIREGRLPAYRIGQRRVALREQDVAAMIEPLAEPGPDRTAPDADEDWSARPVMLPLTAEARERQEASIAHARANSGMSEEEIEAIRNRRLPPEEIKSRLEALDRAREFAKRLTVEHGGLFPSSWQLLNESRDERTRQLMNDCD